MSKIARVSLLAFNIFLLATVQPAIAQAAPAPPPVRADVNSSTEEEIKALEVKLAALIVHGGWDEYEKHLASDYTRIASGGKLENEEDVMSGFRTGPRKVVVMEPEDLRARMYGETAVLQGQFTTSVRESGHVITRHERFTEVFVKRDGQWYLAAEQETMMGK